jgi:hypothetical protein
VFFIWMVLSGWDTDTTKARIISAAVAGFMLLLVLGLVAPNRFVVALRVAAGMVALLYFGYFLTYVASLLRGERQEIRVGQPSALMAGIGLLIYGVPALIFAFGAERVGLARLFGRASAESDQPPNEPHDAAL